MPDSRDVRSANELRNLNAVFVSGDAANPSSTRNVPLSRAANTLKIPAVFVPQGSAPPGYPYIPFGTMTLDPEQHDGAEQGAGPNRGMFGRTGAAHRHPPPDRSPSDARANGPESSSVAASAGRRGTADPSNPPRSIVAPASLVPDNQNSLVAATSIPVTPASAGLYEFAGSMWPSPLVGGDQAPVNPDPSLDAIEAAIRAQAVMPTDVIPLQSIDWTTLTQWPQSPLSAPPPPRELPDKSSGHTDPDRKHGGAQTWATPGATSEHAETTDRTSNSSGQGVAVILPNGSTVPDVHSSTGHLMSPVSDLSPVAAAGRKTHRAYQEMLHSPKGFAGALPYLAVSVLSNVGQGGRFDYQRQGNHVTGFTQFPQYRVVSNFNVGLFCQQAGLSLEDTLVAAGRFASVLSSNTMPEKPYGLDPRTAEFIKSGYVAGENEFSDKAAKN